MNKIFHIPVTGIIKMDPRIFQQILSSLAMQENTRKESENMPCMGPSFSISKGEKLISEHQARDEIVRIVLEHYGISSSSLKECTDKKLEDIRDMIKGLSKTYRIETSEGEVYTLTGKRVARVRVHEILEGYLGFEIDSIDKFLANEDTYVVGSFHITMTPMQ